MFNLEEAIQLWLRSFRKHRAFADGSIREMELHVRDHIDDLLAKGYGEKAAFSKAVETFGDVPQIATEEFSTQQNPSAVKRLLHMAMLGNYFKIASRTFWKNKFYSFVNLSGLTIGLSVVFLIALFVVDELNFDSFHSKKDRLYRVVENQYYSGQPVFPVAVTPTALGPGLLDKYPEIVNFTRISGQSDVFEVDDKKFVEDHGASVDKGFFELFDFPIVKGSIEGFKDQLNALVLSQELAVKYFEGDDPIGKSITLDDEEFVVIAVMEEIPDNSHLYYRYFRNFEKYLADNPDEVDSWGNNWLYTYVELSTGSVLEDVNRKIIGEIKTNNEQSVTDIYLQPMLDVYLGEVDFVVEVGRKGEMQYVQIFSVVAFFILLISCINFMNLSTARSMKRAKEVGLRKTIGASRYQLVFQFLGESVLLAVTAVLLSITIVYFLLPEFNNVVSKEFTFDPVQNPATSLKIIGGVLGFSIITGILAGLYPAFFMSSMQPATVLKSEKSGGLSGAVLRKVLVIFQFAISVVLMVGTMVVYQQLSFIQNKNLGYDKENLLYVFPPNGQFESFAAALREHPDIRGAGSTNNHPAYVLNSTAGFDWKGKDPESTVLVHYLGMDEHFLPAMGMEMVAGRMFSGADTSNIIVNQEFVKMAGLESPLGELVTIGENQLTIIGVVKDFHFKSIHTPIEPLLLYTSENLNRVLVRVRGDRIEQSLAALESTWNEFFPDDPMESEFLESDFVFMYRAETRTRQLAAIFALLAVFISCLGLFGLVSYAAEQRTKEVGIRKVLGASVQNLFVLLTGDFTKLILLALVVSLPIGWVAMDKWLEGFAYHISLSPWIFALAGILAILIAIFTVSYQSIKVSISNPVRALRNE